MSISLDKIAPSPAAGSLIAVGQMPWRAAAARQYARVALVDSHDSQGRKGPAAGRPEGAETTVLWWGMNSSSRYALTHLANAELLVGLTRLVAHQNQLTAELLAHLAEVDGRRLYLEHACSSMFMYCVELLHLSESATAKRIAAARTARKFPLVFGLLAAGELHLSGLVLLAPHLTPANHRELLAAAVHRSKRQLEELLAARFPQPDVPAQVRKLPAPAMARGSAPAAPVPAAAPTPPADPAPTPVAAGPRPAAARAVVAPLAAERYKVQFTASRELRDKLREAHELLGPGVPAEDVAQVVERALDALLQQLRRRKYGETTTPPRELPVAVSAPPPPAAPAGRGVDVLAAPPPGALPAAVVAAPPAASPRPRGTRYLGRRLRREVSRRDGRQCTFVDPSGRRCPERRHLHFHHLEPYGRGGPNEASNLALRCPPHDHYAAVQDYGADYIARRLEAARTARRPPTAAAMAGVADRSGGPGDSR